ncbi:MAG: lipoyl synthase, partial [Planctomycetota bacterium]
DRDEPRKVADAVAEMKLRYVVLTSVNRDDLEDQGAPHFAETVRRIHAADPDILVEVLIPDFRGDQAAIRHLIDARPEVIAHNVETVRRLTPKVRDYRATFDQSLKVLDQVKREGEGIFTKTSIMLGLSETEDEVAAAMDELRAHDVDILTLGQYLQPTWQHLPVQRFVTPEEFEVYGRLGEEKGFRFVASGPLVRSSYRAGELFIENLIRNERAPAGETAALTRTDV